MTGAQEVSASADQALVAAARVGTVGAFEVLVERYHAPLLSYLVRQTGDQELAADLAQETFLDAFRSLDRFEDDRSFAAWLYRIAWNNVRAGWRRRQLRRAVSLDWLLEHAGAVVPALRRPSELDHSDERDVIQQVLDELSPPLRQALLLHSLGGFTSREVALILGISRAAAERRIGRAKEQFRARYGVLNGAAHDGAV